MPKRIMLWVAPVALGFCAVVTAWPPAPPEEPAVAFEPYPEIKARGYLCYRATGPVAVDGKLDEAAWKAAPWSEEFIDIEGAAKPKPRHRTRMKMLWDDRHLYVAARLEEPHVWGTLTKHDSIIFQDNDFEVFLDPDGDGHLYAELEVNALNATWDLLLTRPYKDGGKAVNSWEIPGLRTAVHVEGTLNDPRDADTAWTVEVAWPWESLAELSNTPSPPKDGDQWRINFSRVEWRHEVAGGRYRKVEKAREDNWVWSPQGFIDMHRPERWGIVQFSNAAPGKGVLRADPSAGARYLLHRVYYAQRDFHKARNRWATSLGELGLKDGPYKAVRLETTSTEFEASMSAAGRRWHIRADARFWGE